MNDMTESPYPGSEASALEILASAEAFRAAFDAMHRQTKFRKLETQGPIRLCAIQGIELYLNAVLIAAGVPNAEVRAMLHDLGKRLDHPAADLKLRKKTEGHIRAITKGREFLICRYGPERRAELSELTRLHATLEQVAEKCAATVTRLTPHPYGNDLNPASIRSLM